MYNIEKAYTISSVGDEEEVQRICIALTQDKTAYLYRYRGNESSLGYYWTLSTVMTLKEHIMAELKDTRVSEAELRSLETYDKKVLQIAAWEVGEDLIYIMKERGILDIDEEKHEARPTEIAFKIGEIMIERKNL